MDLYLHTGGRSKGEWFPDAIAGVSRCSHTEIRDDLEFIQANLPFNAHQQAQQQQLVLDENGQPIEGMMIDENGDEVEVPIVSSTTAASASSSRNRRESKRKMTKSEKQEADLEREAAASKRARLQHKIQLERHRLEQTKTSGFHLRQTLDTLRAETQQYEDAIAQTKREMDMIQRETQILEERLQQSRSEYHWGLDQAERIRIEEEKIETILREKLSHVNTQVNDVSDRVHQLRQLEEEFKLKDVRIQQLETECSKYETQIQLLDQLITKQIAGGSGSASSSSTSAAGISLPAQLATPSPAVPAPSPSPPAITGPLLDPMPTVPVVSFIDPATVSAAAAAAAAMGTTATVDGVKAEDVNMVDVAPTTELKLEASASASSTASAPTKTETIVSQPTLAAPAEPTTNAPTTEGHAVAAPAAVAPVTDPLATNGVGLGITPLLPIPTGPNPSLSDLLTSIHSSTTTIAHLQMSLKLHEEQLESSNRQLIDRDRAMKYMQEQIERFSNLNHELNYKLKQSENLTIEERNKLEQSYKLILFGQKEKDEKDTMLVGYEEKLRVYEQLLKVADTRATDAETTVADMLSELKSTRMSNQILQTNYNKLLKEYERSIREKYQLIEDSHKVASGIILNKSTMHVRQDSTDSGTAEAAASSNSPKGGVQLSHIKEEPRTPQRQLTSSSEEAGGFGGINGLMSPMDHNYSDSHSSHSGKFEFHAATCHPELTPDGSNAPALAAHYHKLNLLLTSQNRELSLKLNQANHHNTQLQCALVKLAHRPMKQQTIIQTQPSAATVTSSTPTSSSAKLEPHPNGASSATAMDVDHVVAPPQLTTSNSLTKTSSGSFHHRHPSPSSSPLLTPKSPLPPLHPKKPIIQEELTEL